MQPDRTSSAARGQEILPLVVADLTERIEVGTATYGSPLAVRSPNDALRFAYEEALDLALYLRQELARRAAGEDTCQGCGGRNVVWFAPNDLWNRVMRGGDRGAPDAVGIVCPACFILRAEAAGVEATGWLVQPEAVT